VYQTLKNLSPTEQIGALFVIIFGLLMVGGLVIFLRSMREFDDPQQGARHRAELDQHTQLLKTSWFLVAGLAGR
jgi:phosphatidate cytidylyltransferase